MKSDPGRSERHQRVDRCRSSGGVSIPITPSGYRETKRQYPPAISRLCANTPCTIAASPIQSCSTTWSSPRSADRPFESATWAGPKTEPKRAVRAAERCSSTETGANRERHRRRDRIKQKWRKWRRLPPDVRWRSGINRVTSTKRFMKSRHLVLGSLLASSVVLLAKLAGDVHCGDSFPH